MELRHRRIKRAAAALGTGVVLLAIGAHALRELMNARGYQLFGAIVARIDTSEPVVALTFDDGPLPSASCG